MPVLFWTTFPTISYSFLLRNFEISWSFSEISSKRAKYCSHFSLSASYIQKVAVYHSSSRCFYGELQIIFENLFWFYLLLQCLFIFDCARPIWFVVMAVDMCISINICLDVQFNLFYSDNLCINIVACLHRFISGEKPSHFPAFNHFKLDASEMFVVVSLLFFCLCLAL